MQIIYKMKNGVKNWIRGFLIAIDLQYKCNYFAIFGPATVATALHNQNPAANNSRYGSPLLHITKLQNLFNKNFFKFQNFQNTIDLEFR